MNILVVGSGGREHALIWKIKQSPKVTKIYCAPGNGGISKLAECVDIAAGDIQGLAAFAREKKIGLTVVGPEVPLVMGIVDEFEKQGLKVFGPSRYAAQLEGSKVFAKEFMARHNIPTAEFRSFSDPQEAKRFLDKINYPVVVKADGLAAGKGVFICGTKDEANAALTRIMQEKVFGDAGKNVVVEECLIGEEASILAVTDGESYLILEPSQDHKRIFDDDLGPNTGGMGAYSPAPVINEHVLNQVKAYILSPAIDGMAKEGIPFKGVLYAGLMVGPQGPQVLEFNVRFGDPETQAVLPRLKNDLLDIMLASCEGNLGAIRLDWDKRSCVCVVMSSGGYPGSYEKGKEITGLEDAGKDEDTVVFHAGTKQENGRIVTSGGRVLGVTSLGNTIEKAIETAYIAVEKIKFDRCFFRRDIGAKAVKDSPASPAFE